MTKKCFGLTLWFLAVSLYAQETFPKNDVTDRRTNARALTHVTLHVDHETVVRDATLLIAEGRVVDAGAGLKVPAGFAEIDMQGMHVYPSFVDPYSHYGVPKPPKREGSPWSGPEVLEPRTKGAYSSNDAIKAHQRGAALFTADEKAAKELRKAGFGAVLTFQEDGIARGTGAVVTLEEDARDNRVMVSPDAATLYSFSKGSSAMSYPSSTMGVISLLRQTELDARWYAALKDKPFSDMSLTAWLETASLPRIFEARNWKDVLRIADLGRELGTTFIVKDSGDAYQRAAAVKATGQTLILSLDFPEAPDVKDALDASSVSLSEMKHWELAPGGAATLAAAGVPFAFTGDGLKKPTDLLGRVRKAIARGLDEGAALRALTSTPAKLLGVEDRLGSLRKGRTANFLITDGPLFGEKTRILENWVRGTRDVFVPADEPSLAGTYSLTMGDRTEQLTIDGKPGKYTAKLKRAAAAGEGDDAAADDGGKGRKKAKDLKLDLSVSGYLVALSTPGDKDTAGFRLSGRRTADGLAGTAIAADGTTGGFTATRTADVVKDDKGDKDKKENGKDDDGDDKDGDDKDDDTGAVGAVTYPFTPFGWTQAPAAETVLIKGATVWTNEADGVLTDTDVLVKNGVIAAVGKNLSSSGARVVDGTGKHLTSGIIDEHSHIALDSTNDTAVNSGMVRMADVVDPEDINIYRNLAGGVVAAQLLHGSANPIGGQSAIVKMRWGATPREMLIKDADGFIKFALGENVKRSSNDESIRYPNTRMGVEQVYVDAFSAAQDYRAAHQAYAALKDKKGAVAPRRDLAMDTMVEILEGRRFITCHSYVQSEINMLMKVAERFGFRVNTFTHILEGYKVADKMAAHGVGGSTFADWWAYKWEVRYAIPYNSMLMHMAGVTVAVNSDSDEMSRRLNQEAAKAVKYGGMSEEDALKMVTLNPAKLLHLDDHMGSIKKGKDADLVLWSDHPLSIYARAELTLVDGIAYFDLAAHEKLVAEADAEAARLTAKILKSGGGKGSSKGAKGHPTLHCDTAGDLVNWGGAQ